MAYAPGIEMPSPDPERSTVPSASNFDDGVREGTCQDWEIEATFFNWNRKYGEAQALAEMRRVFGEDYPRKGVLFAMGTHSLYPDTWLINGVVRLDEIRQMSLF